MERDGDTPEDQAALWNGASGRAWVEAQGLLDGMYQPFADLLLEAVQTGPSDRILDVGCGTGAVTLAFARRLGADGRAVGVDVSEPMIAAARARAAREGSRAAFVLADAQAHPFDPAGFDAIVSRFGVMFFDDPVQAFGNLRRAVTVGAGLHVVTWRSPAENPFMTAAERAAAPLLPDLPPRRPDGPGQFGLADGQRVRRILEQSGWSAVEMRPVDLACAFPEAQLTPYLTQFGPVARMLPEMETAARTRVVETVRAAFEPYVHGPEVRFDAACWLVAARHAGPQHRYA